MPGDILEIRIHGRGGQGAKTASQFIVEAAMDQGKHIQAFPEYGPERMGAPMKTYARISDRRITTYEPVLTPDIVLVIDPTLLGQADVTSGMGSDSVLIVNTTKSAADIAKETGFDGRIYTVDATGISIKHLGRNMPNTPILGAFVKVTGVVSIESMMNKVRGKFLKKIGPEKTDANTKAIKEAYDEVKA